MWIECIHVNNSATSVKPQNQIYTHIYIVTYSNSGCRTILLNKLGSPEPGTAARVLGQELCRVLLYHCYCDCVAVVRNTQTQMYYIGY